MTLYTSTVVTPRRPSRAWAKIGENTALCDRAADHPPRHLGDLGRRSPQRRSSPARPCILEAFIDTWIGPALFTDVLPSLGRLAVGILLAIVVGIAAGTLIGLVRWLRELLEPMLEFFRAVPPPVLIPIIAVVLIGADRRDEGRGDRDRMRCGRCC